MRSGSAKYGSSGFDTITVDVRFVVDKVALWQVFLRVLFFSCQYHSTVALYTSIGLVYTKLRRYRINCNEKRPSRDANSSSASQNIPHIFRTCSFITKFTTARYLSLSWTSLTQSMSCHHFFKINFNIILLSRPRSWGWSRPFRFSYQILYMPLTSPHTCHMPRPSHLPWLNHHNPFADDCKSLGFKRDTIFKATVYIFQNRLSCVSTGIEPTVFKTFWNSIQV
jgi:hypothetical protein